MGGRQSGLGLGYSEEGSRDGARTDDLAERRDGHVEGNHERRCAGAPDVPRQPGEHGARDGEREGDGHA